MKVLVACEESQVVCKAFRDLGHEAWSCDIVPCSGGHPEWHMQCDVRDVLHEPWDMVIAFPPCTHLSRSGARWWPEKRSDGRQQEAIEFFMALINAPCERICVENPIGYMSVVYRKPDQIIQPWMFGEDASKETCLWLKGLPKLEPTEMIIKDRYSNQTRTSSNNNIPPQVKDRARLRSMTYPGIAMAMAQ